MNITEIETKRNKENAARLKKEAAYSDYLEKTKYLLQRLEQLSKHDVHFTLNATPEAKQTYLNCNGYYPWDAVHLSLPGFVGYVSWNYDADDPEKCICTRFFFSDDAFFGTTWTIDEFMKRLAKCYR